MFFRGKAVARVTDIVDWPDHAESKVAEGAERVFANNWPIARIGHKTTCDGTINDGIQSIAIDIDTSAIAVMLSDFLPIGGRRDPGTSTAHDGDPIDVVSGRVIEKRTDLSIPGTIPLRLERCHASWVDGAQGNGCAGTWSQTLTVEGDVIHYLSDDGLTISVAAPDDEVTARNLRFAHLELLGRRSEDLFLFDRRQQVFLVFAAAKGVRPLDRIEDRNGNTIRFLRGQDLFRVEHSDGFALRAHSERGRILSWADQKATREHYAYDATGRIDRSWSDSGHPGVKVACDTVARRSVAITSDGAFHTSMTAAGILWPRRTI